MTLTDEQIAIVQAGDVDVAVSAGAGTGKTHVLVERYLHLLGHCTIPEIVAITFTEAAAAEMRQRVRMEVMQRAELEHHRRFVDEAVIGTIHSFCLRLLREYPVEAGLDPGAEILAEDEGDLLRRIASAASIDDAAEADNERAGALALIGTWQLGQALPNMVASRDDVRRAFASMPGDSPEEWATGIRALLDEACARDLDPLRGRVADTLAEVQSVCLDEGDLLALKVAAAAQAFGDTSGGDIQDWRTRLDAGQAAINLVGGRGAAWSMPVADVKEELRALRDEVRLRLKRTPAWNDADQDSIDALPGLRAIFEDACARYASAKAERHALDFADLEIEAVRLLEEQPSVAESCSRRYRHIMVDESQDVSGTQARLIRRLIGEGSGRPRLFLVGDAKQSIYAFRGADVERFQELRRLVMQWKGLPLPLSASFRTHPALVQHMNALFRAVFANGAGGAEMEPMTGRPSDVPPGPHLVLMPVSRDDRSLTDISRRLMEADIIAEEIARLLAEGRPVWSKRERAYRPIQHGDIAILLRRFTNVYLFEQALEARDIPSATPSGSGFFQRSETVDLGNLLRWLAEPDDEIALMAVLRSPMFILGDDTLAALRGQGRARFIRALADPPAGLEADEAARCAFALDVLGDLRRRTHSASAADLLEEALERTGYEASWAPLRGNEQVLANIRKFAGIVRGLGDFTLAEVAEYLAQRRDETAAREGPAALDRPDAVQIMTVHGSKGLEFGAVFVPEGHLDSTASHQPVRWRPDLGLAIVPQRGDDDETVRPGFADLLRLKDIDAEAEEHLRLFYVAVTRAADYVYLSGDDGDGDGWLHHGLRAAAAGTLPDAEVRPPAHVDLAGIARQRNPATVALPPPDGEEWTSPLMERPTVIPLRSSTPATSLKTGERPRFSGHGDGLGRLRGSIAHRVIELAYTAAPDVDIETVAREEDRDGLLDAAALAAMVAEVRVLLDRFKASPIGEAIARPEAEAQFETPFAWYWNGIPVHGTIDLLYRDTEGWRVVDFKTDRVEPNGAAVTAAPYRVQLGVYARALEAASGRAPRAGLLFLRTGEWHEFTPAELDAALAEARLRIDAGETAEAEPNDGEVDED
ncbi:MAG: UvrD-helicase domain-containing protein [Chloroflexi bacterium]|nr:UvrD-helicase domain-containing protein [Chloroflexota bacterium]MDA1239304.1 UvrD-helicase domain-containing protein [Chloroflexota bacterium]